MTADEGPVAADGPVAAAHPVGAEPPPCAAEPPDAGGGGRHGRLIAGLGLSVPPEMLERALTHRSYAYENGGLPTNERLEFLGDAVLGLVVTEALYRRHPDLPEGQLAKLRASVVNMRALAEVARALGVGDHLRLGRGEESTGGRDKTSILADTLEALIGAAYLAHGPRGGEGLVHRLFDPLLEAASERGAGLDWKTALQELASARGLGAPQYVVTASGPDHAKSFRAGVELEGVARGHGEGRSKKEAEQRAAEAAHAALSAAPGGTEAAAAVPGGGAAAEAVDEGSAVVSADLG